MNFFKRLFRKPAIILVTIWAKRTYEQGVRAAEERHRKEKKTVYLAAATFRPDHLVTYTREEFRSQKKVFGFHARLLTVNTLREGCYYYTADKYERNGMRKRDKEIRRQAFIKERLTLARLI